MENLHSFGKPTMVMRNRAVSERDSAMIVGRIAWNYARNSASKRLEYLQRQKRHAIYKRCVKALRANLPGSARPQTRTTSQQSCQGIVRGRQVEERRDKKSKFMTDNALACTSRHIEGGTMMLRDAPMAGGCQPLLPKQSAGFYGPSADCFFRDPSAFFFAGAPSLQLAYLPLFSNGRT
jgi:hypothetical protein